MKKLILVVLLAFSKIGLAQVPEMTTPERLEIGKLPAIESWKSEGFFFISYQDYQHEVIDFQNLGIKVANTEALYLNLKKAFKLPRERTMTLQLPENVLTISTMKTFGTKNILLINRNNVTGTTSTIPPISLKQLDILFGKS